MTNEDKQIVAEYMGWKRCEDIPDRFEHYCSLQDCCHNCDNYHPLDLNDAALCVAEMQKRGEFRKFTDWTVYQTNQHLPGMKKGDTYYYDANFIAWLFNADNFFTAFVEWRKTK